MATIYAVVSPHSQIQIKTEMVSPQRTPTPQRPLRPVNKDGEPGKARRQLAMNLNKGGPVINNRRNARERNRVKQVNQGFAVLRAHLPVAQKNKKISKVDTLRGAIDYIQGLSELLAASERYEPSPAAAESAPLPAELYPGSAFQPTGYGLPYSAAESAAPLPEPPSYTESVLSLQQQRAPPPADQQELLSALRWWHGAAAAAGHQP